MLALCRITALALVLLTLCSRAVADEPFVVTEVPRFVVTVSDATLGTAVSAAARSPQWPAVRQRHLEAHPTCAACGANATQARIEVHHVRPLHLGGAELDPTNLITLCRSGRNCHLNVGHDPDGSGPLRANFQSENVNVRRDAAWLLNWNTSKLNRIESPPGTAASPAVTLSASGVTSASRAGVVPSHAAVTGLHSHDCAKCGTTWSHGSASHGDRDAHTCPRCSRVEWSVSSVAKPSVTLAPSQAGCVNGVCPLPSRRRR